MNYLSKSGATKIFSFFLRVTLYCVFITEALFGGKEGSYIDRYPKFSKIIQTDSSIQFAGAWMNRYILAERMTNGKWQVYTSICSEYGISDAIIVPDPEGLLFLGGAKYQKFLFRSNTWETIPVNSRAEEEAYSNLYYRSQVNHQNLEIKKLVEKINLPLPSYNAFKRWRFTPDARYQLEAEIGPLIKKENDLWFLISFYAGEGITGVGGVGLYDIKEEKIGILRDKMLSSNSAGLMTQYGDTLIIATNHSGEYGIYGDRGIVLLDIKAGLIANPHNSNNSLKTASFSGLKIIDHVLWITTDRSIISWDIKNNQWQTFIFESLIANKKCPIYRRAISYSDFSNGSLPRKIDYDSMFVVSHFNAGDTIECIWPSFDLADIISNKEISGWISKKVYNRLINKNKYQGIGRYPIDILYSDSTLKSPFHSFQTSQILSSQIFGNSVYTTINSAWINMDDVEPVLTKSSVELSPEIEWHSILSFAKDVKTQAFLTFEKEQDEIKTPTPVLDTTLIFSSSMDLYDKFYGTIDAKWLPSEPVGKNQLPQGIRLNYYTELWIKNNKLKHNGRNISIGDSISAVDGDAKQTYTILDYKAESDYLTELKIKYTLVMVPLRQ